MTRKDVSCQSCGHHFDRHCVPPVPPSVVPSCNVLGCFCKAHRADWYVPRDGGEPEPAPAPPPAPPPREVGTWKLNYDVAELQAQIESFLPARHLPGIALRMQVAGSAASFVRRLRVFIAASKLLDIRHIEGIRGPMEMRQEHYFEVLLRPRTTVSRAAPSDGKQYIEALTFDVEIIYATGTSRDRYDAEAHRLVEELVTTTLKLVREKHAAGEVHGG